MCTSNQINICVDSCREYVEPPHNQKREAQQYRYAVMWPTR